jgi:RNA ligase
MKEFRGFPKMSRWSRDIIITEKIDGTNASIYIGEDGEFLTASRTRWITPDDDNFGFSAWAHENKEELLKLGVGTHFGEWWGRGIQRNYGLSERYFSLFNVTRWLGSPDLPKCCKVVPMLFKGYNEEASVTHALQMLKEMGSAATRQLSAPNETPHYFYKPEGIVIFHTAANIGFKKTIEDDEVPKSRVLK